MTTPPLLAAEAPRPLRGLLGDIATVFLLCFGLKLAATLLSSAAGWHGSVATLLGSSLTLAAGFVLLKSMPERRAGSGARRRLPGTERAAFVVATLACLGLLLLQVTIVPAEGTWSPLLQHQGAAGVVLYLLSYALIGPVGEELLFRGFLQSRMLAALGAPAALIGVNLLFGLGHWSSWTAMVFAVAFGLVLSLYRYGGGSLLACAAIHVVHNSLVYVDKYFFGVWVRV
ncbi:CPBP family intramembrane glutamic endopeptidase [Rubrivivax gelatinosus]|uniref:CPBP family intramembrane glutamic endopeptidase n=1 Tax=Rubrivivax gelatinosus TaxID=28068 RepID=UPI0005C1AC42|nr:type II CAAX endopeptidase family protein [Rubrivivax gelatinosus]MBG6082387.1 membrane protease YdiL (CAAX protease family) [Rubrivivax gelatinosus]